MMIGIEYFFTEESFWSISRNENGVVVPLMDELDEPISGVHGFFKSSVEN